MLNRNSNRGFSEEGSYEPSKIENGPLMEYYDSGKLKKKAYFKDGKPEGVWIEYFENGQLSREGIYKDGKKEGICKSYFENGQLQIEWFYKNDNEDGVSKLDFPWFSGQALTKSLK